VVWAVLLQQLIQTALGWFWMSADASITEPTHREKMEGIAQFLTTAAMWIFGERLGQSLLESQGAALVYMLYWWGIPTSQFFFAMFFIDTWQYFLHRFMHMNKFMYKHFHSVHHRLYVPYAFGSLYNHPVEGFLLDSMGAVIAESLSGMTTRQAMLLFSISTCKTVDDHCGYRLPFDPFQLFSENYADYHDIHHQSIGAKSNFSQPFFVHWDVLLGTRMTREEVNQRREAYKEKTT
jgi:sphinganine C4-monooxygenase